MFRLYNLTIDFIIYYNLLALQYNLANFIILQSSTNGLAHTSVTKVSKKYCFENWTFDFSSIADLLKYAIRSLFSPFFLSTLIDQRYLFFTIFRHKHWILCFQMSEIGTLTSLQTFDLKGWHLISHATLNLWDSKAEWWSIHDLQLSSTITCWMHTNLPSLSYGTFPWKCYVFHVLVYVKELWSLL